MNGFLCLDSFGVNAQFRDRLESIALKTQSCPAFKKRGTPQQATQLLPYIPNILGETGCRGVRFVQIKHRCDELQVCSLPPDFKPTFLP